jgi:hypothetical protein
MKKSNLLTSLFLFFGIISAHAQLTVSVSSTYSVICAGVSDPITTTVSGGTTPYTYSWSPTTDLSCTTCPNPNATLTVTSTYTVIVTDYLGATGTASVNITVNPLPNVVITLSSNHGAYYPDTLTASGAEGYVWSTGATTSRIIVTPSITTTYSVTGTNLSGCSSTASLTITLGAGKLQPFLGLYNVCGLNYVTGSTLVETRSQPYGFNTNGSGLPTYVTISGLNSCYSILHAYLYWTESFYTTPAHPYASVSITQPSSTVTSGINANLIGVAQSKLWAEKGTAAYRADVTPTVNSGTGANGTYDISISGAACTSESVDGVTLIIIYQDLTTTYGGSIELDDGIITEQGGPILYDENSSFGVSYRCFTDTSEVHGFYIISDDQYTVNGNLHQSYINTSPTENFTNDFWDFDRVPVALNMATSDAFFNIYSNNTSIFGQDAFSVCLTGLYWQNSCATCGAPLSVSVSPASTTICSGSYVSITANPSGGTSPYTYSWSSGQTSSSINVAPSSTTTYTITVTDANGCSASATSTVNLDEFHVISPTSPIEVCQGSCTYISVMPVDGTSPYTYSWSSSNTWLSPSTSSTPEVCPPANATLGTYSYYATVTDHNGCTSFGLVQVTVNPTPEIPIITGPVQGCGGIYSVTNVESGMNYSWTSTGTPSSGTTATTSPYLVSFGSSSGIITFTATNPSTGCSSSSTYSVIACCTTTSSDFDLTISTEDASTVASTYGTSNFNGISILINGTFNIDQNSSFTNCKVAFTPRSEINIAPGYTLTVEGDECTHMFSLCDTMWQGIVIQPGGSFIVVNHNFLIEDAIQAILAKTSGTTLSLFRLDDGAVFNKCREGIVMTPTPASFNTSDAIACVFTCRQIPSSVISACNFYADWNAAPTTTLLPPYSTDRSYIGISISGVHLFYNFIDCYFDNQDTGVYSFMSNVGVFRNYFQNINYTTEHAVGVAATGYYLAPGNTLIVGGVGPGGGSPNSFTNCDIGVAAGYYLDTVAIINNTFDNSAVGDNPFTYAIDEGNCGINSTTNILDIQYNNIKNAYTGIRVFDNEYVNGTINYNRITTRSCALSMPIISGITVDEVGQPSGAIYNILEDTVITQNYGIQVNGTNGSTVDNDTIDLGTGTPVCSSSTYYYGIGIGATGCDNAQIGCNEIKAILPTVKSNTYTGVLGDLNENTLMIYNYTNYPDTGIQLQGSSATGDNIFLNHFKNLSTVTSTGIQYSGAYPNSIGFSGAGASDNRFPGVYCNVRIGSAHTYYYSTPGFLPTGCSFTGGSGNTEPTYSCASTPPPPHRSIRHNMNSNSDSLMMLDIAPVTKFNVVPDSSTIISMEKIALNLDTFLITQDTASVMAKEGVIRVLWNNQNLLNNYSILKNFNDSISNASLGEILATDTAMQSSNSNINYQSLLTSLSSIVPANNIETNLQIVGEAFLTYKVNNSITNNQLTDLRNIAKKCPDIDGDGVYQARALLALFDPSGTNYTDSSCMSSQRFFLRKPVQNKIASETIALYPNPNNGNFTLEYNIGNETNGKVRIYNTLGEMVGEYSLENSEGTMNISNTELSNGVYIWKLYTNSQVDKFGKIIIIK